MTILIIICIIIVLLILYTFYPIIDDYTVLKRPVGKTHGNWNVIYTTDGLDSIMNGSANFKVLDIRLPQGYKKSFGAGDPFIYKGYIFAEIMKDKGAIGVAKLIPDQPLEFEVILEDEFHFSYPFIYEENGEIYMIPETYKSGFIKLYKCIQFPNKWVFVKNLVDIPGIDTVIIPYNNQILLITNDQRGKRKIHTYISNSIQDEFKEIETSIPQLSRGAGGLLNNKYLPRQRNYFNYGQYIDIYDTNTWKIVSTLRQPRPFIFGNHHISQDPYSDIIVMDIKNKII